MVGVVPMTPGVPTPVMPLIPPRPEKPLRPVRPLTALRPLRPPKPLPKRLLVPKRLLFPRPFAKRLLVPSPPFKRLLVPKPPFKRLLVPFNPPSPLIPPRPPNPALLESAALRLLWAVGIRNGRERTPTGALGSVVVVGNWTNTGFCAVPTLITVNVVSLGAGPPPRTLAEALLPGGLAGGGDCAPARSRRGA